MAEQFLENKYHRWYDAIVAKGEDTADYVEKHHILPRSIGGLNKKSNIIRVTACKHFLLHWLLTKFTEGNDLYKMLHAFSMMSTYKDRRGLSSWQYEEARRANSVVMALRYESESERKAQSDRRLKYFEETPEAIRTMSVSATKQWEDPVIRAEMGAAISKALKGRKSGSQSVFMKGLWEDSGLKESRSLNISEGQKAYCSDPQIRLKKSEIYSKYLSENPDARAGISARAKKQWARMRGEIPDDRTPEQLLKAANRNARKRGNRIAAKLRLDVG